MRQLTGMSPITRQRLRYLAANLVLASGLILTASPWYASLDASSVITASIGIAYLIIALGLFGQSRFTLFVAVGACLARSWLLSGDATIDRILLAMDLTTCACCIAVLWQVRNEPSR